MYKIMGRAAVLTVVWMLFAVSMFRFTGDRPPRANIVPAGTVEVNGMTVEIPRPDAAAIQSADRSLAFITEKTYQQEMAKYKRMHVYHGLLTVILALAVFIFGVRLGGYACGFACLLSGPLAVAYMAHRSARLT